jgi:hypothetical protein
MEKMGHVPRKYSDKVWAEFRQPVMPTFDKLREQI